jgi:hypothetical protein
MLGIGRDASYEAAKQGRIPVLKFGKRKQRVSVAVIERMLQGEGS